MNIIFLLFKIPYEIPIKTYKIGQIIENNNPGGVSGGLFKEP
jgi:hypothetical protein